MMGFFDKLNPFRKKEKSPDMDMGGMGKDPFGAGMGADFGSQNFPDAWNSGSGGMDPGMGSMGGAGTGMGGMGSPAQPSFSSPSYSSPSYSAPQPTYGNDADYMHSKNLEVISSKIDALRAAID